MVKDRTYAAINIIGLTVGLSACMLVGTVVLDDSSYDTFWSNHNDLYRILTVDTTAGVEGKNESAYLNLGKELVRQFPEAVDAASVRRWSYTFRKTQTDEATINMDVIQADTAVWQLLDIPIVAGNPQQYTAGIGNLIITESFRDKHFTHEDPVGKTIYSVSTYDDEAKPFLITGVMADLPANTYLRSDGLQVRPSSNQALSREGWGFYDEQLILMKPNTDMADFAAKANRWYRDFLTDASAATLGRLPVYAFQPITDIYLKSEFAHQEVKGSLRNNYLFAAVALFLLAIGCINFVNLSTARAIRRLRETGVRKVLGASRGQLVRQFLTEGLLFFGLATILAFICYGLAYRPLENFLQHELSISFISSLPLCTASIVAIGLMATLTSTYPAFVLSRSKTSAALSNRMGSGSLARASTVRKALVTIQFGFALMVLIGMMTIWRQLQYMADKDLGYQPANVLTIPSFATGGNGDALKQEISRLPGVEQVSLTGWTPTHGPGNLARSVEHPQRPDEQVQVNVIFADADLPTLLGMHVEQGRLFDERETYTGFTRDMMFSDDEEAVKQYEAHAKVILTASTAQLFGIETLDVFSPELKATPVGIVRDFHNMSLHDPMKPTIIQADENMDFAGVLIKVTPGAESHVMHDVGQIWRQFHPEMPLQLEWLDDMVQHQYAKENRQGQLFTFFSALALFLASLGLFGLVVHATEQRIKEIGIRKVLGASVGSIVRLFAASYAKLIALALLAAAPVAWWTMNSWLEDFAYRVDVEWWVFALAGLITMAIALVTVSWQAIRAAMANPVDSLRDE